MDLVVFLFWPHQKPDFEVFEHNKDASHAPKARKLLDSRCPSHHSCGCLPGAHFPKSVFENKTERWGEEREKRKRKEGEREEKGRRSASKRRSLNGSSAARAYELWPYAGRCTRAWIVFFFFARFSYVGGAFFIFAFFHTRKCSKIHAKAILQQEDGGICSFWTRFGIAISTTVSASDIDR